MVAQSMGQAGKQAQPHSSADLASLASVSLLPLAPLTLQAPATSLRCDWPVYLAPMEGITDAGYRELVIACGGIGIACTDYLRLHSGSLTRAVMRRRFGPTQPIPVGIQFMASDPKWLATACRKAERIGAAFVDINAGCPSPRVFQRCAGSGLLAYPEQLAQLVQTMVAAVRIPVTVKIRLGIHDRSQLAENIHAVAESGVQLITVHGRLRQDSYARPTNLDGIAEAVSFAARYDLPVVANGGVRDLASAQQMISHTRCHGLMIGHGLLADPFLGRQLAGGKAPTRSEAIQFLRAYADYLTAAYGESGAHGRFKRLLRYYNAAHILEQPELRTAALRCQAINDLWELL